MAAPNAGGSGGAAAAKRPRCFLDVTIGGRAAGRVVVELRADVAPRTARNFMALCTGEAGVSAATRRRLHYAGTPIHRVIPGFMAQGGDTWAGDGSGGESIYGETFADETFALSHDGAGVLAMANAGAHTNGSQWYLTLKACPWLDGKHVVFGKLVEGMDVLRALEAEGSRSGATRARCAVSASGVLPLVAAPTAVPSNGGSAQAVGGTAASEGAGGGADGGEGQGSKQQQQQQKQRQEEQGEQEQQQQQEEEEEDEGPTDAEYAQLNPRQRRLADVKRRLAAARRANVAAAVAERKRERAAQHRGAGEDEAGAAATARGGGGEDNDDSPAAKRRWFEEKERQSAEELRRLGLPPDKAHRLESAEAAAARYERDERKRQNVERSSHGGPRGFGDASASAAAYERRVKAALASASVPAAAGDAGAGIGAGGGSRASALAAPGSDALLLGYGSGKAKEQEAAGVDRMVAELARRDGARGTFSRRRPQRDGDVLHINPRNAGFNARLERTFDTSEIKANLERGTALPDK